ncbi:copper chaperone PCu(A)C [Brevundimonas sp. M20]|uniref:copper chaperone PCu(A)C n=1 Tax=Brevundimonas sp. M20 TaxID=2591463 RepID=UPI0011468B86|nr:copper chaperone PCu(A)C [Brevundimonas sp. M20]QDH74106.1 copper chaperone PCu(A)C [Brevundimonas sp. M20]
MIRTLIPLAAVAALLGACSNDGAKAPAGSQAAVVVADALCRPTPVGRQATGCYLTLTSPAADTLVSISTPAAGRTEIHESKIESNMMMMRQLKAGLPLPAGQTVELKPGGNHIMLLAIEQPLTEGQTIPLTLNFAAAAPVTVQATIGQPKIDEYGTPTGH